MVDNDNIPILREGDPYPGASYFNLLRSWILRALHITVEDGSGLTVSQGTDGTVIGGDLSGSSSVGGSTADLWMLSDDTGIPAAAGASLLVGDWGHGFLIPIGGGDPVVALNRWTEVVPPNRIVNCYRDPGLGVLIVRLWGCADITPPE